ncbi:LytR C-terminal domain-containing protein [Mycolicibacterium sp.]|uniref:LytR C-terminal domain-containing protein n=1 Tax=Mycolicibacterium sp. TaxID=2320850 RepID=UPI001D5B6C6A|nr:LytR C-terminal domain-containing protein [Mycolicibacterium sp.]MCB1286769.1 LytR C-terminal domain-containing protein [Mycobacterium sp.]MCB9410669.1 LytR C-terminal domain-containing protein [Mycolicibacterium sp.]
MSERVPDSSGLPLRAMVMVLLFLGVIFLLVGFQAMRSGGDNSDDTVPRTITTTTTKPPAPKSDVRVYSVFGDEPAATRVSDRLREAGWNVTEASTIEVAELPVTTVYFGPAEGEQAAAEAVGKILEAPVAPRIPEIAEQPPGVIVLVTG